MDPIENRPKVRVVAKIKGCGGDRAPGNSITVHRPDGEASGGVFLSFAGQSSGHLESYLVDCCYEPEEDNSVVFLREIEPLVSGVFEGRSVTTVEYGARGSGKTTTIEGSEAMPGLAVLAMGEIIKRSESEGISVSISVYEVHQENICDLLNPGKIAVSILEDAKGSIILKGLSQVSVNSISEFQKLYTSRNRSSCKSTGKVGNELPIRSHKGLIIHVMSPREGSAAPLTGKMNFLDLAGYEDARRESTSGLRFSDTNKINKAMYSLHKVVRAINGNDVYVPFRESKVTRLLQDSLEGLNKVVVIVCLNALCQDSVYMAKLASESCSVQQLVGNSSRKSKSRTRPTTLSSCKSRLPPSSSISTQKRTGNQAHFLQKSVRAASSSFTGKKLFIEDNQLKKTVQEISTTTAETTVQNGNSDKENSTSTAESTVEEGISEMEISVVEVTDETKNEPKDADNLLFSAGCLEELKADPENNLDKENYDGLIKENGSPLLSVQLRELSNNLKKLYYSTPPIQCNDDVPLEGLEPKTPMRDTTTDQNERQNLSLVQSPLFTSRTCYPHTKNSLAQEYLRFINSASKEELKGLKGIGEKRASYILELRETSPEPFKQLDDLKSIGLSAKQIKKMLAIK